jgi:hypothetical protein
VIRSTIEFGNAQAVSMYRARSAPHASATVVTARRATSPLAGRLSQLRIVTGRPPARRRASSAETMASIVGFGVSTE